MKKYLFFFTFGILTLSSCFLKKNSDEVLIIQDLKVEKVMQDSIISRIMISENSIDTSKLTLHYQYYSKVDSIWKDSVNQAIAHFVFLSSNFEERDKKEVKLSNQFFISCLDSFHKKALQDYSDSEYSALWAFEVDCKVLDENEKFITLSNFIYTYTGGAHGNSYQQYMIIDKKNGRELMLSDFISNLDEFNEIAEEEFRTALDLGTEDLEELGFWFEKNKFTCNNNFYFDDKGFHFLYNSYEIAPYAMGQAEFSVPFTLSKHLLKIDLIK